MNKKVEITIEEGQCYTYKEKEGVPFTSVEYNAYIYGGASPCNDEQEINSSIENAKKTILSHQDIPVINDKRAKRGLNKWL